MLSETINLIQIFLAGMVTSIFLIIVLYEHKNKKKSNYITKIFAIIIFMIIIEFLENFERLEIIEEAIPILYLISSISLLYLIYSNAKKSKLLSFK